MNTQTKSTPPAAGEAAHTLNVSRPKADALAQFLADPSPAKAVALAIADHRAGKLVDWPFIDALVKAQAACNSHAAMVERLAASNEMLAEFKAQGYNVPQETLNANRAALTGLPQKDRDGFVVALPPRKKRVSAESKRPAYGSQEWAETRGDDLGHSSDY